MSKIKAIIIELSELAEVIAGQSPESSFYTKNKGTPFLQGNRTFGAKYPSIDTYTTKVTKLANKGDVLMSVRAPVGDVNIANSDICIGRGLASIRAKNKDNDFIYYALKYNMPNLLRYGNGTTFASVNRDDMEAFKVIVPANPEDRKNVSHLLSSIDEKIELNNKINSELENMAKTLYDYWFVQFDFPDENKRPYKSANGKMVYNEVLKREIPEGWEVGTFASYIKQDKGGDWGKDECSGNYIKKVHCIRGADFPSLTGHSSCKAPIRFILNKNSSKILSSGDLVIEISGGSPTQSTGRIGYINQHVLERFDDDVITSNFCKALSLNNKNTLYNFYLEWERLYKSGLFFNYEGKTTGIKNLLFDTFVESYKIAIPPQNIINAFYDTVRNIFEKIQCNAKENHYLETIRDFLLPLLMNGQVTISSEH